MLDPTAEVWIWLADPSTGNIYLLVRIIEIKKFNPGIFSVCWVLSLKQLPLDGIGFLSYTLYHITWSILHSHVGALGYDDSSLASVGTVDQCVYLMSHGQGFLLIFQFTTIKRVLQCMGGAFMIAIEGPVFFIIFYELKQL